MQKVADEVAIDNLLAPEHSPIHAADALGQDVSVARSQYDEDASIVLIGIRGSGKSSLAVLAATAYSRRLIDFERAFSDRTGHSLAAHRRIAGISEHHRRHRQILSEVLHDHGKGCVIVCNFSDLEQGAPLLRRFSKSHPVIHVLRDVKGVHAHVKVWTEEKTAHLLAISGPLLRSCSNFEYFNKTEDGDQAHQNPVALLPRTDEDAQLRSGQASPRVPYLTLKRAERDFLKFLRLVVGDHSRIPGHQSAYPLSQIAVEYRAFTYNVIVVAADVIASRVDLDALQIGADAIEVVYDTKAEGTISDVPYFLGEVYSTVRRATILPMALNVSFDATSDNPSARDNYVRHLHHCLRLTPEYLVVSLALDDTVLSSLLDDKGNTKIIGLTQIDHLPGRWDNPECRLIYQKAVRLKCDVVRMTAQAVSMSDNYALQSFRHTISNFYSRGPPLSAFNIGLQGRPSQWSNLVMMPVTAAQVENALTSSTAGSITAQDATKALYASFYRNAMHFCIIGALVSYSLSPAMHNAAYNACGMPHVYTSRSSNSLEVLQKLAEDATFGGAAVTQPFKIQVVGLLSSLSRHARIIGAANTVLPLRKGTAAFNDVDIVSSRCQSGPVHSLHGDNTDWIGIRACIRRGLSPINTVRPSSCGLVIGAGGMARAAIYAMITMGVQNIFICNRTPSNAEKLAEHYNGLRTGGAAANDNQNDFVDRLDGTYTVRVIQTLDDAWPEGFRLPSMVVSSVPTQNIGGVPEATFTLPSQWLGSPTGGVVVEVRNALDTCKDPKANKVQLTYKPLETRLVQQMRAEAYRGWVIMDGLDMLPEQAFAQFELFTGRRAPRRLMRDEALRVFHKEQSALKER